MLTPLSTSSSQENSPVLISHTCTSKDLMDFVTLTLKDFPKISREEFLAKNKVSGRFANGYCSKNEIQTSAIIAKKYLSN